MSTERLTLVFGNISITLQPDPVYSLVPGDAFIEIRSDGEFETLIKGSLTGDELRQLAAMFISAANRSDQAVAQALEKSEPHLHQAGEQP